MHSEVETEDESLKARLLTFYQNLLSKLVPINEFIKIREDLLETYVRAYQESSEAREGLSERPNSHLKQWAKSNWTSAPKFDPHDVIHSRINFFKNLWVYLRRTLYLVITVGVIIASPTLVRIGTGSIQGLQSLLNLIPLTVVAPIVTYLWFLSLDTKFVRNVNELIRVGPSRIETRKREWIVAYGIWNSSLQKHGTLPLIGFFYLVRQLPYLPLLGSIFDNPYEYLINVIQTNMDIFVESDGYFETTKEVWVRLYR